MHCFQDTKYSVRGTQYALKNKSCEELVQFPHIIECFFHCKTVLHEISNKSSGILFTTNVIVDNSCKNSLSTCFFRQLHRQRP